MRSFIFSLMLMVLYFGAAPVSNARGRSVAGKYSAFYAALQMPAFAFCAPPG
jgi:hypothetical protein